MCVFSSPDKSNGAGRKRSYGLIDKLNEVVEGEFVSRAPPVHATHTVHAYCPEKNTGWKKYPGPA